MQLNRFGSATLAVLAFLALGLAAPAHAGSNPVPSAVPEPSTVVPFGLAALALGGLMLRARNRNKGG